MTLEGQGMRPSTRTPDRVAGAPSPVMRALARLRSRTLDRELIGGADPAVSAQLAAHAARITAPCERSELAEILDHLARSDAEPWTATRIRPHRTAVRANASELHALAALLRGRSPLYARGIAMLRALVRDGTGPAYTDRNGRALASELRTARLAACG